MFTGILLALLAAVIVTMVIITLDALFDCFTKVAGENGGTIVAKDAEDLIAETLNDAISTTNSIALSKMRKKAGKGGIFVAPVEDGKIVKEKLTLISSNQRDEETQTLMNENNGLLLVDTAS